MTNLVLFLVSKSQFNPFLGKLSDMCARESHLTAYSYINFNPLLFVSDKDHVT